MGRLAHTYRRAAAPKVVKATADDVAEITAINRQFHLPIRGFYWDTPEWIAEEIDAGNYYVIRDKKGVAGAACVTIDDGVGEIDAMATRADLHGKGLGKALIKAARNTCRKADVGELVVGSNCAYGVRGFYEHSGFTCEGTRGRGAGKHWWFSMKP